MTIAFWCLLVVVAAPYLLVLASRVNANVAQTIGDSRSYQDTLTGWQRRAHLAHLNAFEAIPAVATAVMVAEFAHAPRGWIDGLAVAFVACRALHAAFYITDRPYLRSWIFRLSLVCIIGLFAVAALGRG